MRKSNFIFAIEQITQNHKTPSHNITQNTVQASILLFLHKQHSLLRRRKG